VSLSFFAKTVISLKTGSMSSCCPMPGVWTLGAMC